MKPFTDPFPFRNPETRSSIGEVIAEITKAELKAAEAQDLKELPGAAGEAARRTPPHSHTAGAIQGVDEDPAAIMRGLGEEVAPTFFCHEGGAGAGRLSLEVGGLQRSCGRSGRRDGHASVGHEKGLRDGAIFGPHPRGGGPRLSAAHLEAVSGHVFGGAVHPDERHGGISRESPQGHVCWMRSSNHPD